MCSPAVVASHLADQIADLFALRRPTSRHGLFAPMPAKALAVPADNGFGFDENHRVDRTGPKPAQQDPEAPIAPIQLWSLVLALDYAELLWHEKEVKSVANITRKDAQDFLALAVEIPVEPEIQEFKLEEANEVLALLKRSQIKGAAVLKMD